MVLKQPGQECKKAFIEWLLQRDYFLEVKWPVMRPRYFVLCNAPRQLFTSLFVSAAGLSKVAAILTDLHAQSERSLQAVSI